MPKKIDEKKLRLLIMPTRFPSLKHSRDYHKAYACWKEVWDNAFKTEMNLTDDLYSDNFSRQSHVAVLFYDNEPAALTTLNYLDLNDRVNLDDSFFKIWPEITRHKIKQEAEKIMACCNVTVNFHFRANAMGVCWKDLILAMLVRHLKNSDYDSMVAMVRLEKGMEKAAYRTGAHPLLRNLAYTIPGQRVDIVSWPRKLSEKIFDPTILYLVNYVWDHNVEIVDSTHENEQQGEKYAA